MADNLEETRLEAEKALEECSDDTCCSDFVARLREARDKLSGLLGDFNTKVGSAVKENYQAAGEKVKAGVESTESCIRKHPFSAVATAFGLGLVVGLLVNLRRR